MSKHALHLSGLQLQIVLNALEEHRDSLTQDEFEEAYEGTSVHDFDAAFSDLHAQASVALDDAE